MIQKNSHWNSAARLNERLDWMFVDLLTLTVGLLIMQVFILPALRSSTSAGVPVSQGRWIRVQIRPKPGPGAQLPLTLRSEEWGVYVESAVTGDVTHGDEATGAARFLNTPRYGNDSSLTFELLPRDDGQYVLGVWLRSISDERLIQDATLRQALQQGIQFRVFSGSSKRVDDDPDNPLWAWRDLDGPSAFHARLPLDPQLWQTAGDQP